MTGINIETSLSCQGRCAMCCVGAPTWRGTYEHYEAVARLIAQLRPARLWVQGGEVLIQPRTLAMLDEIKRGRPDIEIALITNGSVDTGMVDTVERLFSSVYVSIVGFQPETYRSIMGMPFERMATFVDELRQRKAIDLTLKFLLTPSNLHELPLFLEWAIGKRPARVLVDDAGMADYANQRAPYDYWVKIVGRTLSHAEAVLKSHYPLLSQTGMKIFFTTPARRTLAWSGDWGRFAADELLRNVIGHWA